MKVVAGVSVGNPMLYRSALPCTIVYAAIAPDAAASDLDVSETR